MSRRLGLRSGLLLIARRLVELDDEIPMPLHGGKPEVRDSLLMAPDPGNPRKMRKGNRGPRSPSEDDRGGKSGELPRRGPR